MWHLFNGDTGEIIFSHENEERVENLGLLIKYFAPDSNYWVMYN